MYIPHRKTREMRRALRRASALLAAGALLPVLAACGPDRQQAAHPAAGAERALVLGPEQVTLDGRTVAEGEDGAVTVTRDIVCYQAGQGPDYGEGTPEEAHTPEEAAAHAVVTIREAGVYRVSGTLPLGQLAVDLGEEAEDDPSAVVTVILDGAEVTCTAAPAFMVYSVYECGDRDPEDPSPFVDTSGAGIRVVLADGTENRFTGSHVARIYEPGTTDKLHKYDGAFYSRMSMELSGEREGTGMLRIVGDNEGLDTELHLTIYGGTIHIQAQNDGINTNEDGVSVTAIHGGTLRIEGGLGAEGDGIDSNGHLVISGGSVYCTSNERTPDGGLDADGEILLNGGTVAALGTRNDAVSEESGQPFLELSFASPLPAGSEIALTGPEGEALLALTTERAAQSLTFTSPDLEEGADYTLTVDGVVQTWGGGPAGGSPMGPGGGETALPEGLEEWLSEARDVPDHIRAWLEGLLARQDGPAAPPEEGGQRPGADSGPGGGGSARFSLPDGAGRFSGVAGR